MLTDNGCPYCGLRTYQASCSLALCLLGGAWYASQSRRTIAAAARAMALSRLS